jgi:hypothetical protein
MPLSEKTRRAIGFGAPVPGSSLTKTPKNAPYEKPPQFTKLEDVMNYMMDQLTEPQHLKPLLQMMRSGMPLEAIARTLVFTGFSTGKWTVDLGMLMYKPLMLALIAMSHRAGIKDAAVVMPKAVQAQKDKQLQDFMTSEAYRKSNAKEEIEPTPTAPDATVQPQQGFMQPQGNS